MHAEIRQIDAKIMKVQIGSKHVCRERDCTSPAQARKGKECTTLPKTNIDPDNGNLEDCFPLPANSFQDPC